MALVMALILPFRHRCRDYLVIYLSRSRGLIDRAHVEKKGIKKKRKKGKEECRRDTSCATVYSPTSRIIIINNVADYTKHARDSGRPAIGTVVS